MIARQTKAKHDCQAPGVTMKEPMKSSSSTPTPRPLLFLLLAALVSIFVVYQFHSFLLAPLNDNDLADISIPHPIESTEPLNIVLLYADDWSYTTLGANGNTFVKTPVLDKMADDGMLFTHNCVTTAVCMVSRATLYTGQYASKHKTFKSYDNLTMFEEGKWNETLYPLLKENGYYVGFFGKWHHHDPPKNGPPTFDKKKFYMNSHYHKRDSLVKHITQWNEEDGMEFLQSRPKSRPFALTISFFATHAEDGSQEQYRPMNTSMHLYANETVPRSKTDTIAHWKKMPYFFTRKNFGRGRYLKRYDPEEKFQRMMKNTYRMATEVDAACGRIIEELERQGVLNKTLVIFTTDNGNFHGQHGLAEKWYSYEESLRVPLIVLDPRMPNEMRGVRNSEFTLNIDLAPTMLSAAKTRVPSGMQGRDLAQLYLDSKRAAASWRKEFFYEYFMGGRLEHLPTNFALVRKNMKYIYWEQTKYDELFDLEKDPFEESNIANVTDRDKVDKLRKRMLELQELAASGVPL